MTAMGPGLWETPADTECRAMGLCGVSIGSTLQVVAQVAALGSSSLPSEWKALWFILAL